jgi:hypothetical protein
MFHPLVLPAVALIILGGAEDLGAEEPVPLRLEGAIIDGLGLLHLPVGPGPDRLGGGQGNADGIERQGVFGLFKKAEKVFQGDLL